MTDEINPFRPGGSRYGEVCRHGSLRRTCEICNLCEDLDEANRDKADARALLAAIEFAIWPIRSGECPACGEVRHAENCPLAALLNRLGGKT